MPSHVYSGSGSHNVSLTVTDEAANTTSVTRKVTADDVGLNAHFRIKKDGSNNLKIWFNGDYSHDAAGNPIPYLQWNFGDGYTDTEGIPPSGSGDYTWLTTDRADRLIDWSYVGVPGGIKTRTTTHSPVGLVGDGVANDAPAIQSAINSCPAGEVVILPAGTFRLNSTLTMTTAITLRGQGPTTILKGYSTGQACVIQMGSSSASNFSVEGTAISSGYTKGSTQISVASATGFASGKIMLIDQLNDGTFATDVGSSGTATWLSRANGTRTLRQNVMITNVSGTSISFSPPLFWTYSAGLTPQASVFSTTYPATLAPDGGGMGVENMILEDAAGNAGGARWNVSMKILRNSWLKKVYLKNSFSGHLIAYGALQNSIRTCYVDGAYVRTSSRAYGFEISDGSCSNLIEDSIVIDTAAELMAEIGASGNVFAYCYAEVGRPDSDRTWEWPVAQLSHGAHPMFNLFEGNNITNFTADDTWGSSSHNLSFRNFVPGYYPGMSSIQFAITIDRIQTYYSIIGSILGAAGHGMVFSKTYPATRNWSDLLVYSLGYNSNSTSGAPGDANIANTILRHGNYDYVNSSVAWDGTIASHDIPTSLYLSAKPTWFGSFTWPAIGPDVSGYVQNIPAKVRYTNYLSSGNLEDLFADAS